MTRLTLTGMTIVVLTTLQLFSMPQEAVATLIASENFESYTTGSSVAGGTGGAGSWSTAWSSAGGTPNIASGILSGFGKSLELVAGGSGQHNNLAFRQFASQTGTVYIGFVLQTSANFDGNDFLQIFLDNDTSGLLATSSDADNAFSSVLSGTAYSIRKGPGSAGITAGSPTHANGVANRLVIKLSKSSGLATGNYDELELFVDGTSILSRDSTTTGSSNLGPTLSAIHFRVSNLEAAEDRVYIDDLRIATTFEHSVPEPSGIILASFGIILGIAAFRKRI